MCDPKITMAEVALVEAKKYFDKFGKLEPHLKNSFGRLTTCNVQTEICWQGSPGAPNRHKFGQFDLALARVIEMSFTDLATKAIALLQEDLDKVLLNEEEKVLNQLAQIQEAKARLSQ